MARDSAPVTQAVRVLRAAKVVFGEHVYRYEERGGTAHSARELDVDEHAVLKTLVMETEAAAPLVVIMHGDFEVSTKSLARAIGCKSVAPCKPEVANRHSGYLVGGTSPFGLRKPMPIYLERSVLELPRIFVNGGHRGFLVSLPPSELVRVLSPVMVDAAVKP